MPEIKNTFLKAKMNKDLDDRLIPNGEYRDALNLQISRSESSDVGEFETMLGNTSLAYLKLGSAWFSGAVVSYAGKVIGQYTDEANANIYTFSTAYTGSGTTPRDIQVQSATGAPTYVAPNTYSWILTDGTNVLDPTVLGIEVGMLCWGPAVDDSLNGANFDPYVTAVVAPVGVTPGYINVSWTSPAITFPLPLPIRTAFTIGWANKIHVFNTQTQTLTLLVEGGFLNFSTLNRIYGVNLIEDLLFWTDNRNQPRKINVTLANPSPVDHPTYYTNDDSISVAKYYPYESPKILEQVTQSTIDGWFITSQPAYGPIADPTRARGYVLTMGATVDPNIKIGDIVTGFEYRTWTGANPQQEVWKVTTIGPTTAIAGNGLSLGADQLVVYSQLYDVPFNAPIVVPFTYERDLTFSRPTQTNQGDPTNENYLTATVATPPGIGPVIAGDAISVIFDQPDGENSLPIPQVGDLVTSSDTLGWNAATSAEVPLSDGTITPGLDTNVRIAAITNVPLSGGTARLGVTLTKDIRLVGAASDVINIGNNPDYKNDWGGDPDLLEDIFIRFSYRFKFIDNEYSLIAPFSQICFIPKQLGLFGAGQQSSVVDMDETFKSTIVNWFENRIDNVGLKIPLPLLPGIGKTDQETLDYLIDNYKVKAIDILYKESDGTSIKVVDTMPLNIITAADLSIIPGPYGAANEDIRYYYNFDYKSTKAYKTLPEKQTTRVYDKVPVKALAQEITGNRITYGNYLESYTPPININYEITVDNRAVINLADEVYNNYTQYPNSTLKQNRNYQVGWVLGDKYGRQSSVILSVNDNKESVNGSTVYAPYKSYSDVQALSTYEWLGDVMRMKINAGITPALANDATGEPGTQKAYENTTVDSIAITDPGTNYPLGITTTSYDNTLTGEGPGLGSGLEVEITTVSAGPPGPINGIRITKHGSGYADGQLLRVDGGGNDAIIQVTVNPPNVLGWYSYKFVVKQQEQEYYNVYFPGFTRGWPNTSLRYNPAAPLIDYNYGNEAGETSFAVLLADNIQKVPRNLSEVGPKDNVFNSGVKLYGRINNPDNRNEAGTIWNSDGEPWNCQYYPGRINDTAVQIGLIGYNGFEIANSPFNDEAEFGAFNNNYTADPAAAPGTALPPMLPFTSATSDPGVGGANQAFYGVESNVLAVQIKVGSKENQPNLQQEVGSDSLGIYNLGALVTSVSGAGSADETASMRPFLSVSETEPVESILPLFWESGDTGDVVALNRQVSNVYGGVVASELGVEYFPESIAPLTDITPDFSFLDSAGSQITGASISVLSYTITDGNGDDATSQFELVAGATLGTFKFRISAGTYFWYGTESSVQGNFTIVFQTRWDDSGTIYEDEITGSSLVLTNVAPTISSPCPATYPASGSYTQSQVEFYTYTGLNGSNVGGTNQTEELFYELTHVGFTPLIPGTLTTAVFGFDAGVNTPTLVGGASGILQVLSGTLAYGDYAISVKVHDATDPFGNFGAGSLESGVCTITFTVGYAHAPKAICAGLNPAEKKPACSESIEYYFGPQNYANSLASGTTSTFPSTGIPATEFYNVKTVNYMPGVCAPWPLAYTTAEVMPTSGLKITINFEKTATGPIVNYSVNYTILYRPTLASPWEAATPIGAGTFISPTSPGSPLDITTGINAGVSGAAPDAITPRVYHFDDVGEYAVITDIISGSGCGGATINNVSFYAEWDDLYYPNPPNTTPCTDCIGID